MSIDVKSVNKFIRKYTESLLESLSIQRGYLLETARLQAEAGNEELANYTHLQVVGIELAMDTIRKEYQEFLGIPRR